ncbi:phosphotransferase family protein [Streptomyces sp. NPDC005708]|uniref:phosphotransferase family protein n=1 Tax=Streptomyces sp. NPDC005708 TaxID=3154564 RepID=UPI0033E4C04C
MADTTASEPRDVTTAAVEDILTKVWPDEPVVVARLERLSAGASRLSWAVDVTVGGHTRPLVLQRERARGRGRSDVVKEAALLRSAAAAGVPVPAVVTSDAGDDEIGGAYIVTARVDGETIPRRILRENRFAQARAGFARECGEILGRIHTLPLDGLPDLERPDPLAAVAEMLDGTGERRPGFEAALRWLKDHPPVRRPLALVHGDFRNGNLIMGEQGIEAVLDWELAHIGNPLQDLGWLCARPWRWGAPAPVGGVGQLDDLLTAYQPYGGAVAREELHWWLLFSSLNWGVMCLEQARVHLSGEHRSVELAVLGRISSEMEYDVLRMVRDAG